MIERQGVAQPATRARPTQARLRVIDGTIDAAGFWHDELAWLRADAREHDAVRKVEAMAASDLAREFKKAGPDRRHTILRISPRTAATVPVFTRGLSDSDYRHRIMAAEALAELKGGARTAIPALVRALDDEYADVYLPAAKLLATFGRDAATAIPRLKALYARLTYDRSREIVSKVIQRLEKAASRA